MVENEDTVEVCITINRPADRILFVTGNIMAGEARGMQNCLTIIFCYFSSIYHRINLFVCL